MAKKVYNVYQILGGCEEIVVWAKKTESRPKGNYPLNECSQEELAFLHDEIGYKKGIVKIEMDKESSELYMKNQERLLKEREKGKPKEKAGSGAK